MTIPHLMNCSHLGEGWCLTCINEMYQDYEKELENLRERLETSKKPRMTKKQRIKRALKLAVFYGRISGTHHNKTWVIDQIIRVLVDCPIIEVDRLDGYENPYKVEEFGESEKYLRLTGDGWDKGIEP